MGTTSKSSSGTPAAHDDLKGILAIDLGLLGYVEVWSYDFGLLTWLSSRIRTVCMGTQRDLGFLSGNLITITKKPLEMSTLCKLKCSSLPSSGSFGGRGLGT